MIIFRIKEIRTNKGISAYSLCKKANISRSYLSEVENGKKINVSLQFLLKVADILSVNIKDLFYTKFDIEDLRQEMHKRIEKYGLDSNKVMEISQLIDLLINIEQKKKV